MQFVRDEVAARGLSGTAHWPKTWLAPSSGVPTDAGSRRDIYLTFLDEYANSSVLRSGLDSARRRSKTA